MKKHLNKFALVFLVATTVLACKNGEKEATTTEAKEVAQTKSNALTYTVDTEKSVLNWKGEKPTGSHTGTIKLSKGTVAVNNNELESGSFVVDMNSLVCTDLEGGMKDSLEAHLKGTAEGKEGDFFNVSEYPTATFKLTGVTQKEGKTMVSGNLTIRDKTNNVGFPAIISFTEVALYLKSETFMIDRTKWGLVYGSKSIFDNLGDKFINDDMEIQIELHASK